MKTTILALLATVAIAGGAALAVGSTNKLTQDGCISAWEDAVATQSLTHYNDTIMRLALEDTVMVECLGQGSSVRLARINKATYRDYATEVVEAMAKGLR